MSNELKVGEPFKAYKRLNSLPVAVSLARSRAPRAAKVVHAAIRYKTGNSDRCRVTYRELGAMVHMSEDSVQRAVDSLVELGLISRTHGRHDTEIVLLWSELLRESLTRNQNETPQNRGSKVPENASETPQNRGSGTRKNADPCRKNADQTPQNRGSDSAKSRTLNKDSGFKTGFKTGLEAEEEQNPSSPRAAHQSNDTPTPASEVQQQALVPVVIEAIPVDLEERIRTIGEQCPNMDDCEFGIKLAIQRMRASKNPEAFVRQLEVNLPLWYLAAQNGHARLKTLKYLMVDEDYKHKPKPRPVASMGKDMRRRHETNQGLKALERMENEPPKTV